ncbi:MAG TPA: hypothetical protein VIR16_06210, partial [Candidatus Limnocylindrales bacterium]
MRAFIHRRQILPPTAESSGPGSTVGPVLRRLIAPLTWIGWLSLLGAASSLVVWLWGRVMGGVPSDVGQDFATLGALRQLASFATILLPAALELGYPGVARRNPWLLRGTLLLALALLSGPLTSFVWDWASNALFGDGGQFDQSDIAFALAQALALAGALLQALGWLAFLRGLMVARARPRDAVLLAFALAAVALWVGALLPSFDQLWASDRPIFSATNVIGILVGLCHAAATAGVVAALLSGALRRLQPRLGWAFGLATAIAMAAATIAIPVQVLLGPWTQPDGSQDYWLLNVYTALNIGASLLLFAACLAGIGRGTDARRDVMPRRHAFLVSGDRRVRARA